MAMVEGNQMDLGFINLQLLIFQLFMNSKMELAKTTFCTQKREQQGNIKPCLNIMYISLKSLTLSGVIPHFYFKNTYRSRRGVFC
jgi:hypothetical protein